MTAVSGLLRFLASITVLLSSVIPSMAQQITGVPGSPGATMSIDGKQLPSPDLPFGGKIERNALQSKPWWPPRVVPPKGAPNILLIMTDDTGFGAASTFGGFDVGADTGTPVNDQDYEVPFRFTGKLTKLTLKIDRPKLTPADEKRLMEEGQRNNRASE